MQPHDNNQRPAQSASDRGRDAERNALFGAVGLAFAKALNASHRPVHIAEHGKPVNIGATLQGRGGLKG